MAVNKDLILREELAIERTRLAIQSTFLAFLRTSLYFPVAGISMNHALNLPFGKTLQTTGIVAGAIILGSGIVLTLLNLRKLRKARTMVGNYLLKHERTQE
jgi:putative membrane protein